MKSASVCHRWIGKTFKELYKKIEIKHAMTEVSIRNYRELISNRFLPQLVLTAETVQWSVTETQRSEHRTASNSRPVLHLAGPYLITQNKRGGWVGHRNLKKQRENRTN